MKKIAFFLFLALPLLFVSCEKVEEVPETLKFTVDGVLKDFSKTVTIDEYSNYVQIIGKTSTYEKLEITLPKKGTGAYTEATFNSMGGTAVKPNIRYTDSNGNSWQYFGSAYGDQFKFNINVSKYNSNGEVSGIFDGVLDYSYGNGSSAPKLITITEGKFSHDMETTISK